MATITNYTTLLSAIQEINEDDGQEFINYIPTAIDLAEERLFRELDLPDIEVESTGTLTVGSPYVSKPDGYKITSLFTITTNAGKRVFLKRKTEDYIVDYWPDATQIDQPKYYSDFDLTRFIVAPTPDSNYSFKLKMTAKPVKLSMANLTNYYTDYCKDVLYYATLVEMAKFMKAWSQVTVWEQEVQRLSTSWNVEAKRKRRDGTQTPQNPDGGPNNLPTTVKSSA